MALALRGTLVPIRKSAPRDVFPGTIYIGDDGRIDGVKEAGQAPPPGFAGISVVDLGDAFIYPGLIDLHSHIGYNALPLWTQPGEPRPFLHHDIWPNRSTYAARVGWPAWVLAKAAPEALMVYVQVRALAGGTTGIQGWPIVNRNPANALLRNLDDQSFEDEHGGRDNVRTSALTKDVDGLSEIAGDLSDGMGFIYHCAEGQKDTIVVREFDDLATANCLRDRLIAIHCSALGEAQFRKWRELASIVHGTSPGAVVWSPFSNLWLYRETTDVPAARKHGLEICLGSDWAPSGTKNLLGELKVARLWSDRQAWGLSDFDLVAMATSSPGDMLERCWDKRVGRLVTHGLGDVAVLSRAADDPWANLVGAREEQVQLVVVDGEPRFGTRDLMRECGATGTTSVAVGSARRHVRLVDPKDENEPPEEQDRWLWSQVLARLEEVRADPIEAVRRANQPSAAAGRIPSAMGPDENPLLLELDMPGAPGVVAGPPPDGVRVDIAPIASLRHDQTWLAAVRSGGLHGGVLDALEDFYR